MKRHILDTPTFVTHLECAYTGEVLPADTVHGLSAAGRPLFVRYDLEGLAAAVTKDDLMARPDGMWRYREFLPVRRTEDMVTLGESETPLVRLPATEARLGACSITMKDEGRLPTGSFKARGLAMAESMAKELGLTRLAMPTNGNAGSALAAYGTRGGMETYVFCPADTPEVNVREIALQGGKVWRVNGLIDDCGKSWARARNRWAGSTCRPSRSRAASKARRRWVWSWRTNSVGSYRMLSSIRREVAPG